MPLTLAAGVIAYVSVSASPALLGAEQREQLRLLAVVGQAGYPNAGRMPRKRSAISCSVGSFGPVSYQARRATSWRYSANASARRSARALTMIAW